MLIKRVRRLIPERIGTSNDNNEIAAVSTAAVKADSDMMLQQPPVRPPL